jgi:hypothetical protein
LKDIIAAIWVVPVLESTTELILENWLKITFHLLYSLKFVQIKTPYRARSLFTKVSEKAPGFIRGDESRVYFPDLSIDSMA